MYVYMCTHMRTKSRSPSNQIKSPTAPISHAKFNPKPHTTGDRNKVKIGAVTNVQDHAVISTVAALETGFPAKVEIGNQVTIGAWIGFGFGLAKDHGVYLILGLAMGRDGRRYTSVLGSSTPKTKLNQSTTPKTHRPRRHHHLRDDRGQGPDRDRRRRVGGRARRDGCAAGGRLCRAPRPAHPRGRGAWSFFFFGFRVFCVCGGWLGLTGLAPLFLALTPFPPSKPTHQLWGGNPVKFLRKLDDDEITANVKAAEQYHALAAEHANEFQPFGAAYLDAEKAKTA